MEYHDEGYEEPTIKNDTLVDKPRISLVPPEGIINAARAMEDGLRKHGGEYNFRKIEISYMKYLDKVLRHVLQLISGEDVAEDSQVRHEGHAIADLSIILDAMKNGNLIDDRPKRGV